MILKDVADITGFDISTISRVVKANMQIHQVELFCLKIYFQIH
jgi:DNA-directed RNA polymerase specialized sigma54-like protein